MCVINKNQYLVFVWTKVNVPRSRGLLYEEISVVCNCVCMCMCARVGPNHYSLLNMRSKHIRIIELSLIYLDDQESYSDESDKCM